MSEADELRLLREAIQNFPDALAIRSKNGEVVACSDAYARLAPAGEQAEYQSADGRWLRRTVRALEGGGTLELHADVSFLAHHDTLTGLPNRRLLDDRLRQAIRLAQRRDRMVAMLLVHLDALGRDGGEALLRQVAERLSACVRKADTLARTGANEFALVICDLRDEADCSVVADKVLEALGGELRVSIGISLFPADAGDGEALLRNADAAVYRAKQLGRNQVRFFAR